MELIKLKFVDLKYDFIINSKCILIFNFFRMILIIMGEGGGGEYRYVF